MEVVKSKPFFQSKIVLLALTLIAVGVTQFLFDWLSLRVPADQIDLIVQSYPQWKEQILRVISLGDYAALASILIGILFTVLRGWFTDTKLLFAFPKLLPEE